MRSESVILAAVVSMCLQGSLGLASSVKTISNYAKVATNVGNNVNEFTNRNLTKKEEIEKPNENNGIDYEDFDDLQEQSKSLNQPSTSNDLVKYFSGLISLFALFYGLNEQKYEKNKVHPPNKSTNFQSDSTEPRNSNVDERPHIFKRTGIPLEERQDRFDFPRKKFKNFESTLNTAIKMDQQLQPLENYPPYNPLTANTAETYGNNDKKTSYDVYVGQTPLPGNPDYKENQLTYHAAKPNRESLKTHATDDGSSWNTDNIHPVYQPWMSNPQYVDQTSNQDSYHTINSYQSWQDIKTPENVNYNQNWAGNSAPEYSTYNHDFEDHQHSDDHHQDHPEPYHEIEHHPVDEDRVSKKPYSYYFLGRKLWYIPLLFSVYFIMYVGALVLKSVARHKIQFPEKVWDLHEDVYGHSKRRTMRKIDEITENYENAIENVKNKFM